MQRLVRWLLWGLAVLHLGVAASELSDRLKTDHHVLLMRHASAPGVGDPPGYSLERCDTQRLLDDQGKAQAERIGQWLQRQGVRQARIFSSVWCRCRQTAERLGYGPVTVEPSLASFFDEPQQAASRNRQLQRFIARTLSTKGEQALVLVTHHVNIREFMGRDIGSGDMVLARVDDQGRMIDFRIHPSP